MNDDSDAISEALELLKQEKMIEDSCSVNGREPWTIVYDDWNHEDGARGGRYACFAQPEQRQRIVSHREWDFTEVDGIPSFRSNDEGKEVYCRNGNVLGFEPLIIKQEFHGVVPDSLLLSEEFRLLMNLWTDSTSRNFYMISDDGSKELVVRFNATRIEIRTPVLRCYQAIRQLDLVLFTDSQSYTRCFVPDVLLDDLNCERLMDDNLGYIFRNVTKVTHRPGVSNRSFLLAKRILPPPSSDEKCGIWSREKKQDDYPKFIIGEDGNGNPVRYVCNPDKLSGSDLDVPTYCTSVFFKRDVLRRYYDNSELYSVSDKYLGCAQKWGVQIDNSNSHVVSVYLGDIGRDIPSSHWQHWSSYNIPPIYSRSKSGIRCSFLGQFVGRDNPEHQFKRKYSELQKVWEQSWGWRLHREPAKQDAGVIKRLRVPLNETEAEFKQQLLNLALVLVDLLNEKSIGKECPEAKNEKGGGISKLECFLKYYSYHHVERDISVLRTVQSMRSRIAAHASGSSGQKYLDKQLNGKTTQEYFVLLLEEVVTMLDSLIAFAVDKAEQSKT